MTTVHAPSVGWTGTIVHVTLRRGAGGVVRVDGVLCSAPVWVRWDCTNLWLVGSGASPVGDDRIRVHVDVGPGVDVTVRSVAATLVYAATGEGTRWDTVVDVADGANLDWRPEPVILTERARHTATTTVNASSTAQVTLDEVLVLGRTGEAGGQLRTTLDVRVDGAPALLTSTDTSLPGWSGPGGTAGASVLANRLRIGPSGQEPDDEPAVNSHGATTPRADAALLEPAPGCRLAIAATPDVATARAALDAVLSH